MDDAVQALVALSAAIAHRDRAPLEIALAEAGQRAPAAHVEEVLLQSYLFVGYPAALQTIRRWRELSGRPAPPPEASDWAAWAERGARVCSAVYGGQYERLRSNMRALHPDMEQWMVIEGYGKVIGRPGLALVTRELCIVALLAVQDAPQQLYSHLRGALHVGATRDDVDTALVVAAAVAGAARAAAAQQVWQHVLARSAAEE